MVAILPFPGMLPLETSSYHALRPRARVWSDLSERGQDLTSEQLELAHDVAMLHSGKERPADQVSHAVLLDEAADRRHALRGAADDEAILHQLIEVGRDGSVDERMAPPAGVLSAIGNHDVLLGQLARLRSVSAMMRSRVNGHSVMGSMRPAVLRLSRNWRLPLRRRVRSAVGPGSQLSASAPARFSVRSPQPPIQTGGCGFVTGLGSIRPSTA